MRQYRAILKDGSGWVYGFYVEPQGMASIVTLGDGAGVYEVIKDTDGQYSGIEDKNGRGICEGDNVKVWLNGWGKTKDEYTGTVIFKAGSFFIDNLIDTVYKHPKCEYRPHNSMLLSQYELYEELSKDYIPNYGEVFAFSENAVFVEVIGTIHDHLLATP